MYCFDFCVVNTRKVENRPAVSYIIKDSKSEQSKVGEENIAHPTPNEKVMSHATEKISPDMEVRMEHLKLCYQWQRFREIMWIVSSIENTPHPPPRSIFFC